MIWGVKVVDIIETIGKGRFGAVYKCKEDGEIKAIKCIKSCDVHVAEPIIMSSIRHPHLNNALDVEFDSSYLFILQDIAITDLSRHTRNKGLCIEQVKRYTIQITQAIYCLHKNGIIHADIKASNILLYNDDTVKLSDFTLSCFSLRRDGFTHTVCTSSHRPLEKVWSFPLDIWSFGCTIYEIRYGRLLFPLQRSDELLQKWGQWLDDECLTECSVDTTPLDDSPLNNMIKQMLCIEPSKRLDINRVLTHPFIDCRHTLGFTISVLECHHTSLLKALKSACFDLKLNKKRITEACKSLALKLANKGNCSLTTDEQTICSHLGFEMIPESD